jgi:hypothetical protein
MKTIKEILLQETPSEIIRDLKKKLEIPLWKDLIKEFEPTKHKIITNEGDCWPDKNIKNEKGEITKIIPVTRVAVGLQKLATRRLSQFIFGSDPVVMLEDDTFNEQFEAFKRVLKKNRWNSLNKKRCKITSSQCECAVYWYTTKQDKEHSSYGFKTKLKLRHAVFSPELGDDLYPLFDETGDMIAFSRGFSLGEEGKKIDYFETWTAEKYMKWSKESSEWVIEKNEPNPIGKIPIIYTTRPQPIWRDGDNGKVHEIEMLLSRNGEIIAYHSAPVLLIVGDLQGAPEKSESNKVFVTRDGGDAKYVSWDQSPESVKFQFETLLRLYWMEIQMPDLSFENIKGLGAQSGESRKWLMVDPHQKVSDEIEIYEDAISREFNVIKAYLAEMNKTKWSNVTDMDVDFEIIPFTINDDKETIEILATGVGAGIVSKDLAVKTLAFANDTDKEYEQIKKEQNEAKTGDVFGTVE